MNNAMIRTPQLIAGTEYNTMNWDKSRLVETVVFGYYLNENNVFEAKVPQVNKIPAGATLNFMDSNGRAFIAVVRNCAVVRLETGKRLTFARIVAEAAGPVVDVAEEPVGVVVGEEELTVAEDKLGKKRRLDAERKRAARAAAKLAA